MGVPLYRDMGATITDEAGQPDSTTPGGLGLVLPHVTCPLSSGVSAVSLLTSHLLAIFQRELFLNERKRVVVLKYLELAFPLSTHQ